MTAEAPAETPGDVEPNTPRISVIREIIEPPAAAPAGWSSGRRALVSFAFALAIVGAIAAIAALQSRRAKNAQLEGLLPALPLLPASVIQTSLRGAPFVMVPMGPPVEAAARPSEAPPGRRALAGQPRRGHVGAPVATAAASAEAAPSGSDANGTSGRYQPDAP